MKLLWTQTITDKGQTYVSPTGWVQGKKKNEVNDFTQKAILS